MGFMSRESEPTRKALYEQAQQQEIAGRSSMSNALPRHSRRPPAPGPRDAPRGSRSGRVRASRLGALVSWVSSRRSHASRDAQQTYQVAKNRANA
ncbi:hypothetical protein BTW10_11680 [Chromohalobacter japonicus]|uniref:Uncharacterized protein n=1 Tax=Chromohalobacter japonicus TaxID=223900 RepID=A0A1Q8TBW4_9GAMM|nr:hypothetical protein BTW10_11680 [Chromohalobacter japonicus]